MIVLIIIVSRSRDAHQRNSLLPYRGAVWLLACKVHRVTGLNAKFPKILFVFGDLASFTNLAMASIVTGGFEKALLNLKTVRSSAGESFFALPSSSAKYQLISGQ